MVPMGKTTSEKYVHLSDFGIGITVRRDCLEPERKFREQEKGCKWLCRSRFFAKRDVSEAGFMG